MAGRGVFGFEPGGQARRARLEELRTPQNQPLPPRLKAEIVRQIERLELVLRQIAAVEAARDAALAAERQAAPVAAAPATEAPDAKPVVLLAGEGAGARLLRLKGVGPETASMPRLEAFRRSFGNRRQGPPTPAWPRHPGRAGDSTPSRASPRPATPGCVAP
jgi:transposase